MGDLLRSEGNRLNGAEVEARPTSTLYTLIVAGGEKGGPSTTFRNQYEVDPEDYDPVAFLERARIDNGLPEDVVYPGMVNLRRPLSEEPIPHGDLNHLWIHNPGIGWEWASALLADLQAGVRE